MPKNSATSDLHHFIEQIGAKPYTRGKKFFVKLRADTRGRKTSEYATVGRDAALLKNVDVLQGDHVHFHTGHLGDIDDAARSVTHARCLYEDVDRAGDLLPDRDELHVRIGHRHHHFQTGDAIAGT